MITPQAMGGRWLAVLTAVLFPYFFCDGGWIDPDTHKAHQTIKSLFDGETSQLVFSDEFNVAGCSSMNLFSLLLTSIALIGIIWRSGAVGEGAAAVGDLSVPSPLHYWSLRLTSSHLYSH